ncbi:Cytochrome P450, partial [Operophtera brumata]
MILLLWLVVAVVALVLYLWETYSRFSKHGVNHYRPIPLLGNAGDLTLKKCHIGEAIQKLYLAFPNDSRDHPRLGADQEGHRQGLRALPRPSLYRGRRFVIIRDLELIKKVTVKDYEHFLDHRSIVDDDIRAMVPFMVDVNKQMISMLKNKIHQSGTGSIDLECKDLTTRYANDVIASCVFGVKVDSHTDQKNDFYIMGKSTAHFGFRKIMVYLGYCAFPTIMKKFNQKLFEDDTKDFFTGLVMNNMKERETHNIHRPDMIHLLMEAKKAWSNDDLVSQAFLFFLAGFETVSSTMSFLLHELAVNPDVQERLVEEIRENDKRKGDKFDYNSIQNMSYMDMVVSGNYLLRKGESIGIPVWGIHRDPAFFPDPDRFDPERFSEQNKHSIKPCTYMPFGSGPRNCI